jgi:hypothetical protein
MKMNPDDRNEVAIVAAILLAGRDGGISDRDLREAARTALKLMKIVPGRV